MSFVVIAFNEEAGIATTLDSILAQAACPLLEVVVVDDASSDRTAEIVSDLATRDQRVRLIRHQVNKGRGAARHRGFLETRGTLIAYVDGDMVLPADWFTRCLGELEARDLDAVGGIAVPDGDVSFVYRHFGLTPRVVAATTTVTGNNGLYRRAVLERVSFDPSLREGEDVAFNHAVSAVNARMGTIGDLHVRHEESKSFATSIKWLFESGMGATRMLARYRRFRVPDLAAGIWLLALLAGGVGLARGRRAASAAPVAVAGAAAAGHMRRAFVLERRRPFAALGAIAVDTVLLTAYFVGRVAGVLALAPQRSERGGAGRPASGAPGNSIDEVGWPR